jgi:transcriptional regulator NrdR family protein
MVCVYCGQATQVINSRHKRRENHIWRRRLCLQCGAVYTTTEKTELSTALRVETRNQSLQPFNRDQLFISLYESCKHRPAAVHDAANLADQVIRRVTTGQNQPGLISRNHLATVCHEILQSFDSAAATVYAAYHPAEI